MTPKEVVQYLAEQVEAWGHYHLQQAASNIWERFGDRWAVQDQSWMGEVS